MVENIGKKTYLLPSEQEKAIKKAKKRLYEKNYLYIEEPCNCGSHIQHNNGGNYHQIYEIKIDQNRYFVKDDCTSELEPPALWEETTKEKAEQLIFSCSDWL